MAAPERMPELASAPPDQGAERERLGRLVAALAQATDELKRRQQQSLDELRRFAVELALAVASRFLQTTVASGEFPFERIIAQALERLESQQPATVFLHPDDLANVEAKAELPSGQVRFVADPALRRGDCRVSAGDRSVDFDVQGRLGELRRQLLDALIAEVAVADYAQPV
jgi:flagellar assembly protein FliH